MKLLMENWRKQLKEYEITGVDYEPGAAQEEPAQESEESTVELLNQLDELVKKIKDSLGAAPEEEPSAPSAYAHKSARPSAGSGREEAPFEE